MSGDEGWQSPSPVAHHGTIAMDGRLYSLFGGTYTTTGTLCNTVQELAYGADAQLLRWCFSTSADVAQTSSKSPRAD